MYFNSVQFGFFFAAVWATVALLSLSTERLHERALQRLLAVRNVFLLVVSYVFYAFWDWRFLSLIVLSTGVDFVCARRMGALPDTSANAPARKRLVAASVVVNLGFLAFFKYSGFFARSLADALATLGMTVELPVLNVVLPVGISFYTFQTLSYTIDVYRGRLQPEPSLVRFAAYVAFFPQLVAGPIERARDLLPQLREPTLLTRDGLHTGAFLMGWGLFKKVVIADNVARIADAAFALPEANGLQVLLGAYAFAVQIYCDFSGYTDIARGCARMMGFELSLNFDLPYVAQTPSDFWRRWHISLSSWLRDYLYIPLGGNRKGPRRTWINLMLTMLLGGLWHGAAWTFVAWGAFHGALLAVYRVLEPQVARLRLPGGPLGTALRFANGVFFFHLICVSWILFRAADLRSAGTMLAALPGVFSAAWKPSVAALGDLKLAAFVTALLVVMQAGQLLSQDHLFVLRLPSTIRAPLYAAAFLVFLTLGEFGGEAFIYFQF